MDSLPEDRNTLPKYTSDVCKWHLFLSNLTEDVFDCVKETFEMDYLCSLKLQLIPDEPASASEVTSEIAPTAVSEVLKGALLSKHVL